jgi:hypothetical protein
MLGLGPLSIALSVHQCVRAIALESAVALSSSNAVSFRDTASVFGMILIQAAGTALFLAVVARDRPGTRAPLAVSAPAWTLAAISMSLALLPYLDMLNMQDKLSL